MNLESYISKLNDKFIKESKESLMLIKDMAKMEKYMAESYNERIFIELLQNADDAKSSKTKILFSNNYIFFANNGRDFNSSDIESISRSGSSAKDGENTIGYRGIGFKSTTAISDEIYIYSGNTTFSFSKKVSSEVLNLDVLDVPTIRIPFLVDKKDLTDELNLFVSDLKQEGYTTIFIFKTDKHEKVLQEVEELTYNDLIFLNNVNYLDINAQGLSKTIEIEREEDIITTFDSDQPNKWLLIKYPEIQFCFKLKEDTIIPCNSKESVFHCYLPTLDNTPYPFKINGKFSTDPSRKHLEFDDNTKRILEKGTKYLYDFIEKNIDNPKRNVLSIISNIISYSKIASYFDSLEKNIIKSSLTITLNNGDKVNLAEIKKLNEIFEESELKIIRENCKLVKDFSPKNSAVKDETLQKYSNEKFSVNEMLEILKDEALIKVINNITLAKLYSCVLNNLEIEEINVNRFVDCFYKNEDSYLKISNYENYINNNEFLEFLESLIIVKSKFIVFSKIFKKTENLDSLKKVNVDVHRNSSLKWKTAEEQCVSFEIKQGNNAKNVGAENLGYDVISTTPSGEKRYIEVKLLGSSQDFVMTNNEYSCANMYKNNYYLCLIHQNKDNIQFIYINNPIEKLVMTKRVKAWEWYCDEYSGDSYIIET